MNREIDTLIIHTAATKATADIGAVDIDKWHRARGWLGCGYHFVIRRNGTVESDEKGHRCRPLAQAGAHVGDCGPGWNKRSIGICLAGGLDANGKAQDNYTPEQWKALEELVLSLLERLRHQGFSQVLRVVLSKNDSPLAVVKMVIPGMESFQPALKRAGPRLSRYISR